MKERRAGDEMDGRYVVERDGERMVVTVRGGREVAGPEDERQFERFLAEAIESYAEASEMPRPDIHTFTCAELLTSASGLVVCVGDAEFQLTIVRSR